MKETRRERDEFVETEGKCQPRNKNSQQINANDKHMYQLNKRDVKGPVTPVYSLQRGFESENTRVRS